MKSSPANGDVLANLIGSNIRVTMTDGRVASGKFICLDRLGNIMLEDVTERRRLAYHDDTMTEENHHLDENNPKTDVDNKTKNMQYTNESGTYHWTTERSLTQAVIIGKKVVKVEIKKRELELRLGNED